MKNLFCGILVALLGIVGCGKKEPEPPPTPRQQMKPPSPPPLLPEVEAASQRYKAVAYSATQQEVLRSLGTPQMTNTDGALVWQTSEGQQTAKLTLKFKSDGSMTQRDFEVQYGRPSN
jgi:hypothetical protein